MMAAGVRTPGRRAGRAVLAGVVAASMLAGCCGPSTSTSWERAGSVVSGQLGSPAESVPPTTSKIDLDPCAVATALLEAIARKVS